MKKDTFKPDSSEMMDELQITELKAPIEIKLPENYDRMDFADRLEYFWNLNEE
ncbi:MAG: hypothetical protein HUJ54_00760 [Erysipelotrichaceae bacterium]|nr:hypothetical protein [Erysipelotrichaceae bacterium]